MRLEAVEGSGVEVANSAGSLGEIIAGDTSGNREEPFLVTTSTEGSLDPFELLLTVTAENGFLTRQYRSNFRGGSGARGTLRAPPRLIETGAATLAIQTGDAIYEQAGVPIDYFDDNYFSQWPSAEVLGNYKNLIVLDELTSMVPIFRDRFAAFVDGGGNALVHGYEVAWFPEGDTPPFQAAREFVAEYLRVGPGSEKIFTNGVSGIADDVISDGLELTLRTSQYEYRPDSLVPTGGAIPIFRYSSGEVAGIRYEGDPKLIYLGFSINDIESAETRAELWRRIFAWFDQE